MKAEHNIVVRMTGKDKDLLGHFDFHDFIKEVTASDVSCGYGVPKVTIEDFANVVKEEIIKEYELRVKYL